MKNLQLVELNNEEVKALTGFIGQVSLLELEKLISKDKEVNTRALDSAIEKIYYVVEGFNNNKSDKEIVEELEILKHINIFLGGKM